MKSSLRFGVLLVLILLVGVLVNAWSYLGEAHVERKDLSDFPETIGAWQRTGTDRILDDGTLKVLRASDYLLRDFRKPSGEVANLYVGYYASQRTGATYHSPLNCLPGSGWTLSEPAKATIPLTDGTSFVANKYVIQNGEYKSLMIYWYQGRGRIVANDFANKGWLMFDAARLRRTDGGLVRLLTPVETTLFGVQRKIVRLSRDELPTRRCEEGEDAKELPCLKPFLALLASSRLRVMQFNTEHRTPNIELFGAMDVRRSMLGVRCFLGLPRSSKS